MLDEVCEHRLAASMLQCQCLSMGAPKQRQVVSQLHEKSKDNVSSGEFMFFQWAAAKEHADMSAHTMTSEFLGYHSPMQILDIHMSTASKWLGT